MLDRRTFLQRSAGLAAGAAVASAPEAQAQAVTLEGIDVSHWQGTVNWTSVKNSGVSFAFCKATEGIDFIDPKFDTTWAAVKANGIVRGSYHMGRPAVDPVAQARFFYNKVRPSSGDLPCVLDHEKNDSMSATHVRYWAQRFCQELKRLMGRPPIIYTGFYYWRDSAGNSPYNYGCPLWMARWNVADPYPLPGAFSDWTFWQWTVAPAGSVPGVSTDIDRDRFNGNLSALQGYVLP